MRTTPGESINTYDLARITARSLNMLAILHAMRDTKKLGYSLPDDFEPPVIPFRHPPKVLIGSAEVSVLSLFFANRRSGMATFRRHDYIGVQFRQYRPSTDIPPLAVLYERRAEPFIMAADASMGVRGIETHPDAARIAAPTEFAVRLLMQAQVQGHDLAPFYE